MDLPTPQSLGLPEKYDRWRCGQDQLLYDWLNSPTRFTGISAPTGMGKSLAWIAYALMTGERTVVLTMTKGLMTQALDDFAACGLTPIMGKSNYQCTVDKDWTCEHGHHGTTCMDRGTPQCKYSAAYYKVLGSNIIITNYAFWIAINKYGQGLGNFDHLILDEAHDSFNAIADAMSVYLNAEDMKLLREGFPMEVNDPKEWKAWAKRISPACEREMKMWEARISREPRPTYIKNYNRLMNIQRKLATLSLMRADEWVVEKSGDEGYVLDPIRVSPYAEKILFRNIPKVSFLSATIRPKTIRMHGIKQEDFTFHEYDSPFPPENSPVYYIPTVALNYQSTNEDYRLWADRHDQIFKPRLDRKHIVHTGSYERRKTLVLLSKFQRYMQYNMRGDLTDDVVRRFKKAKAPSILVSPSVTTGYDFPGKECESNIIDKVPFPPRQRLVVAARESIDKEYSIYHAIQTLVQASGRSRRTPTDKSETFIIDNNVEWVMNRYKYLAPKWFTDVYSREPTIPRPLVV